PEAALPDPQGAQRVAARAEVGAPVGDHVVEPAADQAERHREHGDVGDDALLPAARHEPPLAPEHRDDDPGDDAQRVGPDRDRSEHPDAAVGTRDVRQQGDDGRTHAATVAPRAVRERTGRGAGDTITRPRPAAPAGQAGCGALRTPPASSCASARTPWAPPFSAAVTNAEPTTTPSAKPATSAAWAADLTPRPTATGSDVCVRHRATSAGAALATASRAPVTPIVDVA